MQKTKIQVVIVVVGLIDHDPALPSEPGIHEIHIRQFVLQTIRCLINNSVRPVFCLIPCLLKNFSFRQMGHCLKLLDLNIVFSFIDYINIDHHLLQKSSVEHSELQICTQVSLQLQCTLDLISMPDPRFPDLALFPSYDF